MKKITHTAKQQARRVRALERFSIDGLKAIEPTTGAAYTERKNVELKALQARVGGA